MAEVVDTNRNTVAFIPKLKENGVNTIVRYYNRDMTPKVIGQAEFNAILASGLHLMIVHQRGGRDPAEYSAETAVADCNHCRDFGALRGQPDGSAIYFGVDFDIARADLQARVIPYFTALKAEMARQTGKPRYRIGVYGSGMTCSTLLDAGLVELTWLSQSTKFTGTPAFTASKRWNLLQLMPTTIGGLSVDPDIVGSVSPDFGQFDARGPVGRVAATAAPLAKRVRVQARDGANLREGPGTRFAIRELLPFGTELSVVRTSGNWSLVDRAHDGAIDGAVFTALLEPIA